MPAIHPDDTTRRRAHATNSGDSSIETKETQMSSNQGDTPVLDTLADMTAASVGRSTLDEKTLMLVRLAALASVDAPPVSYLVNIGAAADSGIEAGDVQQVLIGIAPVVGTARVASAAGNIARALGFAIAAADEELAAQAGEG
jgi:alkylhydroperoxidase/carboxymuconolactone decarboxylase family protein YurZ